MEASAIKQIRVGSGVRTRAPLLRMQSDERLVTSVRRGNDAAFGVLVSRYESRLLAFCRHLLRSREDAEDVLQDVFASAFKAMMADERPIKVRPWLYRIARNRCLNHLRRITAIGVDSIEDHFSEHGPSTSETAQRREDLWQLVGDVQALPESQRSALLLREMEALSYEQIAEVMDKTIPSVKSLLIRARRTLAESAEARTLACPEAMIEVGECHLGERERLSRVVRKHIGECVHCSRLGLPEESLAGVRAWTLGPLAPLYLLKKLAFSHVLQSARAGSTATATAAGAGAAAGQSAAGGSAVVGFVSAGIGGVAGKAAVGLTAAALGVAGAVVVDNGAHARKAAPAPATTAEQPVGTGSGGVGLSADVPAHAARASTHASLSGQRSVSTVALPAASTLSGSTASDAKHAKRGAGHADGALPASTGTVASGTPASSMPTGGIAPTDQAGAGGTTATTTTPSTTTGAVTTPTTSTATTPQTATTGTTPSTQTTPTTSTETTPTTSTTATTATTPTDTTTTAASTGGAAG